MPVPLPLAFFLRLFFFCLVVGSGNGDVADGLETGGDDGG